MNSWTGRSKDGGREHSLTQDLRHRKQKGQKERSPKMNPKYRSPRDKPEKLIQDSVIQKPKQAGKIHEIQQQKEKILFLGVIGPRVKVSVLGEMKYWTTSKLLLNKKEPIIEELQYHSLLARLIHCYFVNKLLTKDSCISPMRMCGLLSEQGSKAKRDLMGSAIQVTELHGQCAREVNADLFLSFFLNPL